MGRNRGLEQTVLSFMSQFSTGSPRDSFSASPAPPPQNEAYNSKADFNPPHQNHTVPSAHDAPPPTYAQGYTDEPSTPVPSSPVRPNYDHSPVADSPSTAVAHNTTRGRSNSRPMSMVMTYHPPLMDVNEDTIPELQPIFTFLNSHANKLYQEGYFLKLDDQNTQGKPNPDRTWTECFAQLVGTVLSLWDAAELDTAGEDGEVLPKFINLTDASIKMIDSLPTRSNEEQPLQNILSISTAGRNRYLLHFNSRHSLIQWTAGIRLAMFEHSTLQEAYTGALIAGKGKTLNNIGVIMERSRQKTEEWVRVRFGAGVPWKRCWCVVSPPDEKEYQKLQKDLKKKSPYDRSHPPILKGDIKFYDTRKEGKKQKKAKPIATITDAYSAYALYPQAKSLIDASTLVKVEGNITIHSDPPSSTEGFVFVMPEVHPAVSGFGMMLQYLFPTWDTFGLYGRPGRLVASTIDPRSLMFAMPKHKRYGYLEILDVTSLILTDGSSAWSEREWRKRLKDLTGQRMTTIDDTPSGSTRSRANSRSKRLSFGPAAGGFQKPRIAFADNGAPSVRSSRSMSLTHRPPTRTDSAPPTNGSDRAPLSMAGIMKSGHARNASDSDLPGIAPPPPPPHLTSSVSPIDSPSGRGPNPARNFVKDLPSTPERVSSDEEREPPVRDFEGMRTLQTPEPVSRPPAFTHAPGEKPTQRPYHSPELRRANSRMSVTTLAQLAQAGGIDGVAKQEGWKDESKRSSEEQSPAPPLNDQYGPPPVHAHANNAGMTANAGSREDLRNNMPHSAGLPPPPLNLGKQRSKSPLNQTMGPPSPGPRGPSPGSQPGTPGYQDMRSPLGPGMAPGPNNRPPPSRGPPNIPPQPRGPPPNLPPQQRGPPNMPPQGRGDPPGNMGPPPPRGPPNNPPTNMYRGHQSGPPGPGSGGPNRPTTPGGSRAPPSQHTTSPHIHRKPLPARGDSLQHRNRPDEMVPLSPTSSNGSFTRAMDPNVLAHIHPQNPSGRGTPQSGIRRQDTSRSNASSNYADSTASPDYASTRPSIESTESVERPRAGVLRTVGDDGTSQSNNGRAGFDIPNVDFGPTFNYGSSQVRNKTPTPGMAPPARSFSPGPRSFSPAQPPPPRRSPVGELQHGRQASDDTVQNNRRSVVWQPATVGPASPGQAISAEQFVQQRAAAAAATPLYSHQRQSSGNTLAGYRTGTPTPPLDRGQGRDYMGLHSRGSSQDLLQRPSSRGAGAVLGGQQGGGEGHLSAREQEHVARMTGTPLINVAGNRNAPQSDGGLVGAIEAREREKLQMKQGLSSQAVQLAINQRQQQQAFQLQQPMGSPPPPPAGMYSNLSRTNMMMGGAQSPGPQAYGFPQGLPSPGIQGGGWVSPGGAYGSPRQGNTPSPGFLPQQGQMSPQYGSPGQSPRQPQPQQGRGQGFNPAYHGHAF
ncbi:PH domain-containing protein [Xylariales sp. AK1849]|nr:PH domain-containing protein [Xylariales sp. AK1849]